MLFPNHRTHILKGAKHFVREEAPKEICDELTAFYDQALRENGLQQV